MRKGNKSASMSFLILYDFKIGIGHAWKMFLPLIFIFLLPCVQLLGFYNFENEVSQLPLPTYMDYMLFAFRGMNFYDPSLKQPFILPIIWLVINLYMAFLVSSYPVTDLFTYGQQVLLRAKNRGRWYLSKCVWCVSSIVFSYIICWVVLVVFALCTGRCSMQTSLANEGHLVGISTNGIANSYQVAVFLLPLLVTVTLSLLQMFITFLTRPIFGMIFVAAILTLSAYFGTPFLIGNLSMMCRIEIFNTHGIQILPSVIGCVCLSAAAILGGYFYFRKKDILGNL